MPAHRLLKILTLATFASVCHAWLQVPLVIINMSPHPAKIEFGNSQCWSADPGPHTDLNYYYSTWLSKNLTEEFPGLSTPELDAYLQEYKSLWGVPKLRGYTEPQSGTKTIPGLSPVVDGRVATAAPMAVFEGETDNAFFGCAFRNRWQDFSITVDGNEESLTLHDPWQSEWVLTRDAPDNNGIILGPGGRADPWAVFGDVAIPAAISVLAVVAGKALLAYAGPIIGTAALAKGVSTVVENANRAYSVSSNHPDNGHPLAFFQTGMVALQEQLEKLENNPHELGNNDDPHPAFNFDQYNLKFSSLYDKIPVKERTACILGRKIAFNYECMVAGTSVLIQADGNVAAIPLPNVWRSYK